MTEEDRPSRALDLIDRKIIALLQQDATLSIAKISRRVNLSQTPCWKRVQRLEATGAIVGAMPEVMELYRMAGDVDYLLRVVVADMAAYDAFYKSLIAAVPLKNVTSRFAMERVKATTAYPVDTTRR